jgi:hypothetical protein
MRTPMGRHLVCPVTRRAVAGAILGANLVAGAPPAAADGLRRLDAAWLIPAAHLHTAVTGRTAADAGGIWLRAGQARLFGLPELPSRLVAIGGAAAGGSWVTEGSWETTGSGDFRDDRMVARVSRGRRLHVGLHGAWRRLQPGPGPVGQTQAVSLDVGADGSASAVGDWRVRLRWPLASAGDRWLAPETGNRLWCAVAAPGRALAVTVDVAPDGRPAVGWEALCGIGGSWGLSWRVDRASAATGCGLAWCRGRLRLRTSHLAHPELGITHRVELAFGNVAVSPW